MGAGAWRRIVLGSGGALFALAVLSFAQPARTALNLHQAIEREIAPGQTDVFTVEASAGQFVSAVVRKKGIDAVLTVLDPAAATVLTADSPSAGSGPEPASFIAQTAGTYSFQVTTPARGRYQIELTGRRDASERDSAEITAEGKLYTAAAKERSKDRETRLAAIQLYKEDASLWHALNDTYEEALCLHRLGAVNSDLGDQQKALEFYEQALKIRHDSGDRPNEAISLNAIAGIDLSLGEQQKALDVYQQLVAINRATGDRHAEARALNSLAYVYLAQGEQQKSLDTLQQALALQRSLGDRAGEAYVLTYLAQCYRDLGAEEKALDYFQQSLTLARAEGVSVLEADTLMGMGDAYFFLGEKQKSLDVYQQSLQLKHAANDRSGEALALIGMGNVYSNLGARQKTKDIPTTAERQKALDYYEQSLTIGRAANDYPVQVFALMGAGVAYSAQGDKQKALNYLKQALFFFGVVRYKPGEGWAKYEIARVERDRGNLAEAKKLVADARETAENMRSKVLSQDLRATLLAAVQDCYSVEMDILMRLHAADPSKGYEAEALTVSERARARVLLDALGEAGADIREGVDPELLERAHKVQAQLNAKETARLQMLASTHTPETARDIETSLRNLAAEYDDLNTQIRARSPHYAALQFPQPLTPKEIQKDVLDPDTLLLEYALGLERSFLWVVSPDSITSVVLPKRSEVEAAARRFHDGLIDPAATPPVEAGKNLSRMLLGDVAKGLGAKRLLIVADGALQYLPFSALPDPDGSGKPLVVNHEIVNVPSASTLAILRRETANRAPAPKTLAVLADPVFSATDSRIQRGQSKPAQRSISELAMSGFRLPRLPGTRREAAWIASFVPERSRKEALDFDASRATLTGSDISQYRILHLATHGLLNTEHPELSGVVLSLVDPRGLPQDGFLRLNEIYNLKLQADLVVLSACQTGLGKDIQGEGLVGLTRGFMYAGSPRVLASLWKVDDHATAELMKRFYGAMLGPHALRPAAALRAAQIEMMKTNGWENPYHWAAFTLQGEWR